MDGFVPGEGAGMLLLATEQAVNTYGLSPIGVISLPGIAVESGHRYSEQPYRGDGLADAFSLALENCPNQIIQTILASLNGENLGAKEYGVAVVRNKEKLAEDFRLEHPADCFGDIGAAFAPVLTGIACIGMLKGYLKGPALVYSSSDIEWRGACCVNGKPA
jgi:3-oxoacyl-[acyl-carrier-protein] synthase-1